MSLFATELFEVVDLPLQVLTASLVSDVLCTETMFSHRLWITLTNNAGKVE